jgi:hypothetical protein
VLLKIMMTYISFNEGNQRFLPVSLCSRSFVSNEVNAASKQWILAFYRWLWGKKKGTKAQDTGQRENKSGQESKLKGGIRPFLCRS